MFLIKINSQIEIAIYPYIRMNAKVSKAINARMLAFRMQILEVFAQRKFISPGYHAHKSGNIVEIGIRTNLGNGEL